MSGIRNEESLKPAEIEEFLNKLQSVVESVFKKSTLLSTKLASSELLLKCDMPNLVKKVFRLFFRVKIQHFE
jgi:hypothetical protein